MRPADSGRSGGAGGVRTLAVTQDDPFFTGQFFETFLEAAGPAGVELIEIVLLPNFGESRFALLRRMAAFYGAPDLARLAMRYARARVEDLRGRPRSVEAVAAARGVPVRRLPTINDAAYLRTLGDRGTDVILSVAAPEIMRREALSAAPHALNVHSGRLPDYRGMMPTFWALLEGNDHVVVTVHQMAERLDAGTVLAEYVVPVGAADSAFDVARRAKAVAGREVAGLLSRIGTDDWPVGRPIDVTTGRYRRFPRRDDAKRLRESGRSLL
jgi:methionyl-tRNA formyltransferase